MAKKMKHKGVNVHRLKREPEEKLFAEAWETVNRLGTTLDYLLWRGDQSGRPPEASERDREVAATVAQWLGSPVGQAWLAGLGYLKK